MLTELYISNIALIKSLRIEFTRGLNVLTGETGAGKSIVVDCVNLALGHRAGRELIRTGEDKAGVKALFDLSTSPAAKEFLDRMQLDYEDDYAEVTREITNAGRNICRINGTMVTLAALREFTSLLVDLHGQQEHQRLMDPNMHMQYLDAYGGAELETLRAQVKQAHAEYTEARRNLSKLNMDEAARAQRIDLLRMQVNEINAAKLKPDEEETLESRAKIFENAEKLSTNTRIAYERIYLGGKSISAQESIKRACDAINQLSGISDDYAALADRLEELMIQARDIGFELQALVEDMNFDPAEAERVQDRLDVIKKLKRKYAPDVAGIIEYGKTAAEELKALESIDEHREELQQVLDACADKLKAAAEKLTEKRRATAHLLEGEIIAQLKDLGMGRTRLEISFTPRDHIGEDGAEDVEFMISPNPGEPLRKLTAIASGGEISRFMLALKVILAQTDGINTMIFDEIDTGISGRMAQTVGEKMAMLGRDHQLICVTHLAQIAALGDTQFMVEKIVTDEHTDSRVRRLTEEERTGEIGRLVGGAESDESAREHARSMLDAAARRKAELRGGIVC